MRYLVGGLFIHLLSDCLKGLDWNPAFRELLTEGAVACGLGALTHGGVRTQFLSGKGNNGSGGHTGGAQGVKTF